MKKILIFLFSIILVLGISGMAGATTYSFSPSDSDLWDLDHGYYYTWAWDADDLKEALGLDECSVITAITLEFNNIYNHNAADESNLFVWLLDDGLTTGIAQYSDTSDGNVDEFLSWDGINLVTYETPDTDGVSTNDIPAFGYYATDISYSFTEEEIAAFILYLNNGGTIGLGFDADCHYYNDGITLKVSVPEPATMLLFGAGLIGLAAVGRRKFIK